jgi:hypothetical protein
MVREDDLVLTLGAGDVWKAGESLIKKLDVKTNQKPGNK